MSKIVYRGVGADFEEPKSHETWIKMVFRKKFDFEIQKIFSANNEQGGIKRG